MNVADSTIRRLLERPYNEAICNYILTNNPSAHSDIVEELDKSAALLPEHKSYCPNSPNFAYVILFTDSDKIFAAAFGMNVLLFNLPDKDIAEAFTNGGKKFADLPDEWVAFQAFRMDKSLTATRKRLRHWCRIAFAKASAVEEDDENL